MSVVDGQQIPEERGRRDAMHHRGRVRREVDDYLKQHVGEHDIVSAGPDGKIRVPVKSRQRYHFIHDRGEGGGVGQGDVGDGDVLGSADDASGQQPGQAGLEPGQELVEVWLDMREVEEILFEQLSLPRLRDKTQADVSSSDIVFNDLARTGSLLDKRATLKNNLKRNAAQGRMRVGGFDREDLRYLSYRDLPKPRSKAVMMMAMDVSGSFGTHHKQVARLFFYWIVQFLRHRYDQVEIEFIAHHTTARQVSEREFFNTKESGGTIASSAYELAESLVSSHYPPSEYNVYYIHASDGDNYPTDNGQVWESIERMSRYSSLVGYLEIRRSRLAYGGGKGELMSFFEKQAAPEAFILAGANSDEEIWPAIKRMFAADDVETAARPAVAS